MRHIRISTERFKKNDDDLANYCPFANVFEHIIVADSIKVLSVSISDLATILSSINENNHSSIKSLNRLKN